MARAYSIRSLGLGLLVVLSAALVGDARADWPMARHDTSRTGAATGVSDLTTPGAYWRAYLGGRLGVAQVMPLVIDGDAALAFVSSGRVMVTTTNAVPVWSSENFSITALSAAVDLDGDGALELVAQSSARAFAFDVETGALRWAEDAGEMGTLGAVLATDVDGDGLADILVEECACCRLNNGETGYLYSFSDGLASPRRVWRLPFAVCGGSRSLLVDDVDGDGDRDVLLADATSLHLLDGATGAVVATSPTLGTWVGFTWCEAVELDPAPGTELVCVHGTELEAAGEGHRMFALRYAPSPARLELMWTTPIGERDEAITIGADFLRDLDGDGTIEAVVTGTLASGQPQTLVVDAHDGAVLATLNSTYVVGTTMLTTGAVLVTRAQDRVSSWTFARGSSPLTLNWTIDNRRALVTRDWAAAARQPWSSRILLGDVDGDGEPDLYTVNTKLLWEMPVHALSSPTGATVDSFFFAEGSEVLVGWPGLAGQLTFSTSDGRLTTLSSALSRLGGGRSGGYYASGGWGELPASPVAADLDGDGDDETLIADSRKSLLALDARGASNAERPRILWERRNTVAPSVVPAFGNSGAPGVACRRSEPNAIPPVESVVALENDGAVRWETPIGATVFNDVLAGNLDGDNVPDLVVQWGEDADTGVRTTALAGTDGQALWTTVTQAGATRYPAGASLGDWNGDGIDDVVFHHYGTRVLSGVDGAEIAFGGPVTWYAMPTLIDVAGDARPEVTLHGGYDPMRTLTDDLLADVWSSTDGDERPFPYAAVTTCASGPVLVSGSLTHAARLKVTSQTATPGAWQSVVLADGVLYLDEAAAVAAGASVTNQLTSVHIHDNLTGLDHPSAVVGSTDGWLYAVDPCAMTLDFAMPFGVPVGAVAFGDGDGDGIDELIVSTADGYLHGVKQAPLQGPSNVRDIDPAADDDLDVDEIVTRGSLSASWDAVAGATGYEVTVALDEGGIVIDPAWQRVDTTSVTFADLPLEDGVRYVISVRALSDAGPSPDILSDGVLVHLEGIPDAGPSGPDASGPGVEQPGGCCDSGGAPSRGGLSVLAGFVAVALFRVRRARRR